VLLDGERSPGQSVRLHVSGVSSERILAEAVSLPDGQFAVDVPIDPSDDSDLMVEAVDAAGGVLGRRTVPGDLPTMLTVTGELPEADAAPPALLTSAAGDLLGDVGRLEASGDLPAGALGVLGDALGRLAWLDGLVDHARRATLGDERASSILREALGAWAGERPVAPAVDITSSPGGEDDGPDNAPAIPNTLIAADAVGMLASAMVTVGRTPAEQIELADGLIAVLSVRSWLEVLAAAAASGDVPTMQLMMGAPAPMPVSGAGPLPMPGVPKIGFPGLPGGSLGGKPKGIGLVKVHPTAGT
jgi:hypothetical protein